MQESNKLYEIMKDFLRLNFLKNIYEMILRSKCCSGTSSDEWLKIICYVHHKGWLYYGKEEGRIKAIVCAYRIKEFNEDTYKKYPEKEEGNILYVAFAVSFAKDKFLLRKLMNEYIKENKDITEVIMVKNEETKDFLRIPIRRDRDVEEQTTSITSCTTVSE